MAIGGRNTRIKLNWIRRTSRSAITTMSYQIGDLLLWLHPGDPVILRDPKEFGTVKAIEDLNGRPEILVRTHENNERRVKIQDIHWYRPAADPTFCRPTYDPEQISLCRSVPQKNLEEN